MPFSGIHRANNVNFIVPFDVYGHQRTKKRMNLQGGIRVESTMYWMKIEKIKAKGMSYTP